MNKYLNLPELSFSTLFIAITASLLLACGEEKKMEPVPVGELEEYQDPGIGFSISHPKGWMKNAQVGRIRIHNAPEVENKFLDPTSVAPLGVEIAVIATKEADANARIKEIRGELAAINIQVGEEQQVTVGGASGTKFTFTANYGGENIIHGHRVFFTADSMLYDLGFSGFGNYYDAYSAVFEATLTSFRMPMPKEPGRDETLPAAEVTTYDTKLFSFAYPENFNSTNPPKGKNELVVELRGVRQDCSIRFDVFSAEGLDVDKVFEQNKGKHKATSTGKATVGGQPSWTLTYPATKDVERRFYFVVKDNKVFRATLDWYKPQRDEYLKAYDNVVASFKFK